MRYGVTFSHPDMGDDPGFFKEFAQSVEGAGFDHLRRRRARHRRPPRSPDRREGAHLRRALPRAVRPLRLPRRGHREHRADHRHPDPPAAPDRRSSPSSAPSSTCSPADASSSASGSGATGWSTRRSTRTSRTAARGSRSRSRCCGGSGPRSSSPSTGSGTTSIAWGSTRCPCSGPSRSGWARAFGKIVEKVLRRTGRMADGWLPQYPPGPDLADAIARLRGYATEAGRDPGVDQHRLRDPRAARRRSAEVGRRRAGLRGARRDAPAGDDRRRRLRDARRAPRRRTPVARRPDLSVAI